MSPCLVFFFDFDDTIIEGNSDTIPFESLAPHILEEDIRKSTLPWTERMDTALAKLPAAGIQPEDVLDCVSRAIVHADTRAMLALLRECPYAASAIISDSNTLYIDAVLAANGLSDAFGLGIWTNLATFVEMDLECGKEPTNVTKRLSVFPYSTGDSRRECSCPANMCKGAIVRDIMKEHPGVTFVYCGDGSNDFCGAKQLPGGSFVLPRAGFALERKLCRKNIAADVLPWKNGTELRISVEKILDILAPPGGLHGSKRDMQKS